MDEEPGTVWDDVVLLVEELDAIESCREFLGPVVAGLPMSLAAAMQRVLREASVPEAR